MAKKSEADGAASETALETGALSLNDLSALMLPTESEEPETEEVEEEAEDEAAEVEAEEPEDEVSEEEPESILERLNLTGLTEEERMELNRELGGRAAERFGEFTAKNRELQSEIESLRVELGKRKSLETPVTDNPYATKSTMEELREIKAAALDTVQQGEIALEDNEDAGADEEILEVEGRTLTKREVRTMVRNARKALDVYLPARAEEIEKVSGFEQAREARRPMVRKEHPWLGDESSPLKKAYEHAMPKIEEQARRHLPELLPDLEMMVADYLAAESKRQSGGKAASEEARPPVKRKAPTTPSGSGAPSSRPAARVRQRQQAKVEQFLGSRGGINDVAQLFMP